MELAESDGIGLDKVTIFTKHPLKLSSALKIIAGTQIRFSIYFTLCHVRS